MPTPQEVFKLCKQGRLDEALEAGRACLAENPTDEWAKKALGWTLYKLAYKRLDENDIEAARALVEEIDEIAFLEEDEILGPKMRTLRDRLAPGGRLWVQANQAEKAGNLDEAIRLYHEALAKFPDNDRLKLSCGWAIRKKLRSLVRTESPPLRRIDRLVRQFALLDLPRKELVSRLVLDDVTRLANRYESFFGFATRWFGLENLPDEDYHSTHKNGKVYQGRAMRVIKAVAKAAMKQDKPEEVLAVIPFIDKAIKFADDDFWLKYYKGKLFLKAKQYEEARRFLLPVVRAKCSESWAWFILAHTYMNTDPEKAIACLCRAIEEQKDELYLTNVRLELAKLLANQGETGPASYELIQVRDFKETAGLKLPSELVTLMKADWFDPSAVPPSNQPTYDAYAPIAESILIEGLPTYRAIVLEHQEKSDKGPARSFIAVQIEPGQKKKIAVKGMHTLFKLPPGTPITVVADVSDRVTVLKWDKREADTWDLLEGKIGVVEHINLKKRVSLVVTDPASNALLYHDLCAEAASWSAGTVLAVRTVPTKPGRPHRVVTATPSHETPPPTICKQVKGRFTVPEMMARERPYGPYDYGFVDNIYVPHELIASTDQLMDMDEVEITAVASGKGDGKWRAVCLRRIEQE